MAPLVRASTRIFIGLITIPLLRLFRKKLLRNKRFDDELEKDLEQWFRASLLLFFATKNVEAGLSGWLQLNFDVNLDHWFIDGCITRRDRGAPRNPEPTHFLVQPSRELSLKLLSDVRAYPSFSFPNRLWCFGKFHRSYV